MNLTSQEKSILRKRRFRRIIKFWFGVIFRSITYFLVFARHVGEDGKKTGGLWYPTQVELDLVARKKAFKKSEKEKKNAAKIEAKAKAAAANPVKA